MEDKDFTHKNCTILLSRERGEYGQELAHVAEVHGPGELSMAAKFRHESDALLWAKAFIDGWLACYELGPQPFVPSGQGQTDEDLTVHPRPDPLLSVD